MHRISPWPIEHPLPMRLCIINGYPDKTREILTLAGACGADELFVRVFGSLMPEACLASTETPAASRPPGR